MPKEIPSPSTEITESNIYDVKTLSSLSKMKYVLEVFDLGKDKEKNEDRRKNFIELMRQYNTAYIKSELVYDLSLKKNREKYEAGRAELHNRIMEILKNMSLSTGLKKEQREVVSYLAENRNEVTRMITSYFGQGEQITTNTPSEYLKMKEQLRYLNKQSGPEEE